MSGAEVRITLSFPKEGATNAVPIYCFLCFQDYSRREKENKFSSHSLKHISQYLQVDMNKVAEVTTRACKTPRMILPEDMMAPMCLTCSRLMIAFCDYFTKIESNGKEIESCIREIYRRMMEGKGSWSGGDGRSKEQCDNNPMASIALTIMHVMRKAIFEKCELKVTGTTTSTFSSSVTPAPSTTHASGVVAVAATRTKRVGRYRVKCGECGRLFSRPENFETHQRSHRVSSHNSKKADPPRVPNATKFDHRRADEECPQLKCEFCHKAYSSGEEFEQHLIEDHMEEVRSKMEKMECNNKG